MFEFLRLIWDICCLRRGPQDLPYAPLLLGVLCVTLIAFQLGESALLNPKQSAFGTVLFEQTFDLGVLFLLVSVRDVRNRYVQTALAHFGSDLLFQFMLFPLLLIVGPAVIGKEPSSVHLTPPQGLAMLLGYGLVFWKVIIEAHILRHALDVRFAFGVAIAVGWAIVLFALTAVAGGGTAPTA